MYVTFLLKYTPQGSCEEPVKTFCTPRIGSNVFYKIIIIIKKKILRNYEISSDMCTVFYEKNLIKHLRFNLGRIFVQQD